jgi:hypothetical protein
MGPEGVSLSLADYYARWTAISELPSQNGIGRPRFQGKADVA